MFRKILCLVLFSLCIHAFAVEKNAYLLQVSKKLNQIKSATYYRYKSSTVPYGTTVSRSYDVYMKEYINPIDTFVGASYAEFQLKDSTKMVYFYDGKVKSYLDWENKTIPVDSFQNNKYPFRIVYPPFFTHVKSLIRYALDTTDSLKVELKDLGDSVQISLFIKDKIAEVVGNRIVYGEVPSTDEKYAQYDIWINKETEFPYRLKKKTPMFISWETTKNVHINKTNTELFVASKYFPSDFTVTYNKNEKPNIRDLVGKKAPDWSLKNTDNKTITLKDLKSKVLMIQFTGIGCGPCFLSIPFLKQLVADYKNKNFEFISIETWSGDMEELKKHQQRNSFNFKFLKAERNMMKEYQVNSVPVFFILDENRAIRKVINGYQKGTTDKEIKDTVDKLLE
jgi:peroxiredoxin